MNRPCKECAKSLEAADRFLNGVRFEIERGL